MLLGRLLNSLSAPYLKLLVLISLFILGSLSLWGLCKCLIDTPNCTESFKFVSQMNGFSSVLCNV